MLGRRNKRVGASPIVPAICSKRHNAESWVQIQVRGGPKVTPFLTIHFWTVNASPEGETKR
jgi:hypothetical protein